MHIRPRPSLSLVTRALGAAVVISFSVSAVSVSYEVGRHTSRSEQHGAPSDASQHIGTLTH